jgi:hypothetical protein
MSFVRDKAAVVKAAEEAAQAEEGRAGLSDDCIEWRSKSDIGRLLDGPYTKEECTDYFTNRTAEQAEADEQRWLGRLEKARADWSAFEEESKRRNAINAILEDGSSCIVAIIEQPEYASLIAHLPPDLELATDEQLSDRRLPTDTEIQTFSQIFPRLEACLEQRNDRLAEIAPTLAAILRAGDAAALDIVDRLVAKQESWGDYIQQIKALDESTDHEFDEEKRRLAALRYERQK